MYVSTPFHYNLGQCLNIYNNKLICLIWKNILTYACLHNLRFNIYSVFSGNSDFTHRQYITTKKIHSLNFRKMLLLKVPYHYCFYYYYARLYVHKYKQLSKSKLAVKSKNALQFCNAIYIIVVTVSVDNKLSYII